MNGLSKSLVLWRNTGGGGSTDPSSYPPGKCMNLIAKATSTSVKITWEDPEDIHIYGGDVIWSKTILVRKNGSAPTSETDGTIVTTSTVRNQYKTNPYVDNISNGSSYYYAVFACSSEEVYNKEVVNTVPYMYKVMTVRFDITQTPGYGTYLDNATSMPYGKTTDAISAWQEFFGYKPCLFKDGQVVGYLNPNDYTQFENGISPDITSGGGGDVMVEFPRRGIKISKSGTTVTVSMTDNPDDPDFTYYAHRRGDIQKDYFYVGAYLGYKTNNRIRSLSGVKPTTNYTCPDFKTYCQNLGDGYNMFGFYQLLFIQCMYLLQYKGNLDSKSVHGKGAYVTNRTTGGTNTVGMMYGGSDNYHIKLFGIEDLWGSIYCFIGSCIIYSKYNASYQNTGSYMGTNIDPSNNGYDFFSSAYTGNDGSNNISGYITDVIGTSESGFIPYINSTNGSSTTYFCDNYTIVNYTSFIYIGGGLYNSGSVGGFNGIFYMHSGFTSNDSNSDTGTRLMYL